jgi:type II secretory pathway component PulF
MGVVSAPEIIRLAGTAVGNRYLAPRLASAAEQVEEGAKFAEALREKMGWPAGFIERVSEGELSGQLESVLESLANERKEALETRVARVRKAVGRLVAYATILAIAWEIYAIALALAQR